jgi:hypothetical protein
MLPIGIIFALLSAVLFGASTPFAHGDSVLELTHMTRRILTD